MNADNLLKQLQIRVREHVTQAYQIHFEELDSGMVRMHFRCDCGKIAFVDMDPAYAIEEMDPSGILSEAICKECRRVQFGEGKPE